MNAWNSKKLIQSLKKTFFYAPSEADFSTVPLDPQSEKNKKWQVPATEKQMLPNPIPYNSIVDYAEEQQNELEALQSIYPEEFQGTLLIAQKHRVFVTNDLPFQS